MQQGYSSIITLLVLAILIIVFLLAILTYIFSLKNDYTFLGIFNEFIFSVIKYKPSTSPNYLYELINFLLFLTGIIVTAGLIGAITTGLSEKLNQLRNSSSMIFEKIM